MKHNQLRLAVRTALAVGGLATALGSPTAAFAQDEDSAELGRVQVTGSRIKRTDVEGALPVQVIDRETIELSGEVSISDVLRNLPINSTGSFRPRSGSSGQSGALLSLRGLGAGRTLILIDGRRMPTAPQFGVGQDLNSIPIGAVERIEILTDGASAIYGTDAIGGVVNVIMRKDFEGAQFAYGEGIPQREGGDTQVGQVLFGAAGAKGSVLAGVSYNKRDIVFARDRFWSRGGASTFSNNFRIQPAGQGQRFLDAQDFPTGTPADQITSANVAGCSGPGFSLSATRCFYDFTFVSADEAEVENLSFITRANYEINADWSVFGNFSLNRVESFGRYAPVPSSPWLVGGFGAIVLPAGTPNHPGTAPGAGGLNPLWQNYTQLANQDLLLRHRFAANGPRDTFTDGQQYDLDLGVLATVGTVDIEAGIRRTDSQYYEIGRNYIVSALAQPQITSGAYNIYDPFNAPQSVLQSFTATIGRDAFTEVTELYAIGSTDLFDIEHGAVGAAFGIEYRDENYADIYDDLQANGNITGSAGNSAAYRRHQYAGFVEVLVPVLANLEVTAAARYDNYSDFGNVFVPKVAVRWQPLDELTLRASWGEGFRAPPPSDLAQAPPAFSADTVRDDPTCAALGLQPGCAEQVTGFVLTNPNLDAEESDQFGIGAAFQPVDWFSGSIDYYNIEVTDRIAGLTPQTVVNCVAGTQTNCPPNLTQFPAGIPISPNPSLGLGVARAPDGSIAFLQRGLASLGTIETSGVDIDLNTNFDLGSFGTLTNQLVFSRVLDYKIDSGDDIVSDAGFPEDRGILRNVWQYGDLTVGYNINYIGSQDEAFTAGQDGLSSFVTHDINLTYVTPYNFRVTLGVDNIGDKDPVVDFADPTGRSFNVDLYDPYGRITYFRVQADF